MRNNNVTVRAVVCLSLGFALALSAPPASAKKGGKQSTARKAKKKVLVGGFEGPKSGEARKAVIAALKDDGEYDIGETGDAKPGGDDKSYAAASAGATAVLVGTVKKSGLVLSVRNGADGALVQDVEVKGDSPSKLSKNIADSLGLSVADVIAQTKPGAAKAEEAKADEPKADAEEEEKTDKAPAEEEEKSAPASDSTGFADSHSPLELDAGLRAVHRSFSYHDTPAELFPKQNLPVPQTYKLPLGPALFIDATIYPGAFVTRGAGGNFGITAGYETNFGTKSVYNTPVAGNATQTQENTLTTSAHQYYVGAKARVPFSVHELGVVVAYGQQVFNLLGDESNPTVPDLWYKFVKVGIDGRFRFDALSLGVHLGTRLVSSTGGLQRDWFQEGVKTQSVEAGLNVGYTLVPSVDLLVGFDVTRYAFNFNPVTPANRVVAGGAVDQFTSGFLGVRYWMASQK